MKTIQEVELRQSLKGCHALGPTYSGFDVFPTCAILCNDTPRYTNFPLHFSLSLLILLDIDIVRFVFADADYRRTISVTPMITKLGWDVLHVLGCLLPQSAMFHKIHYQRFNISFSILRCNYYIACHDNQLKYQIPTPSTEAYKYFFYPRSIRIWNNLSPSDS